jgi:hypothetical protein
MTEKENTVPICKYCSSSDFDYGSIITGGAYALGAITGMKTYYRSEKEKRIQVMYSCATCLNCGHMELYLDPNQIKLQREHFNKNK